MEAHIEEIKSDKRDRGFTLVELLIVIVILGILATVTVFAVRGITDKGQTSACKADSKTLEVGIEAYFAQYGGATIVTGAAAAPAGATWLVGVDAKTTLKNAGFLRTVPTTYNVSPVGDLTAVAPCTAAMTA